MQPLPFCSFYELFRLFVPLYIKFRICRFLQKKPTEIFDWGCIESIGHFVENSTILTILNLPIHKRWPIFLVIRSSLISALCCSFHYTNIAYILLNSFLSIFDTIDKNVLHFHSNYSLLYTEIQ